MKIIEYGTIQPKIKTCNKCRALLEYAGNDIKKHSNQFWNYQYIICPVCGKWLILKKRSITDNE